MSKVAIEGNALGSGTFTIASPNSNSNRTLNLPDSSGTVVVTGGAQTIEFAAGTVSAPSITTTGDTNTGIFFPAADNIAFTTGGTIRGRWTTDGLCFNADTAAANALDDYEEGTFTPVDASGAGLNFQTEGTSTGRYVKIGGWVFISCLVYYPTTANGSIASVGGLPFTVANIVAFYNGSVGLNATGKTNFYPFLKINTTTLFLRDETNTDFTNANMSNDTFVFSAMYLAA
jgi:hypothetical protein